MDLFSVGGRTFYCSGRLVRVCGLYSSWYEPVDDPKSISDSLKKVKPKLHIFTFFQRPPNVEPKYNYYMEPYSVSIVKINSYDDWWNNSIRKKTRQAVKTAQKKGVEVRIADFDDEFVKGISKIYNETPVRAGKSFPHYNDSIEKVREENGTFADRSVFLGAYYQNELIGFTKVVFEEEFADILQHLAKISHRGKNATNTLLAKAIEVCAERGCGYLAYGDWDDTGLGDYKRRNGFSRMDLPRYYIPLNWTGAIALKLGLHKPFSKLLPASFLPFLRDLRRRWYKMKVKSER